MCDKTLAVSEKTSRVHIHGVHGAGKVFPLERPRRPGPAVLATWAGTYASRHPKAHAKVRATVTGQRTWATVFCSREPSAEVAARCTRCKDCRSIAHVCCVPSADRWHLRESARKELAPAAPDVPRMPEASCRQLL